MSRIHLWYIYLVNAISLQAVTWGTIDLLRNVLISEINAPKTTIALDGAVILIGLPIFLAHWVWGQRLAARTTVERGAILRCLYLYVMLGAFLSAFVAETLGLVSVLLKAEPALDRPPFSLTSTDALLYHLLALLVLGVLWSYQQRIVAEDARAVPETGNAATVRRLYVLGFSAAGLTITTLASVRLLRWVMLQFGGDVVKGSSLDVSLKLQIANLVIGLPLWLIFWRWAQRLFDGPSAEEQASTLRKCYLYGAIFCGALGVVVNATSILAGAFRRVLGLSPQGDIRAPLPVIVVAGLLWVYHAFVLRDDVARSREAPRQAGIRRLYFYLVAAIGLSALLIGLGGDVSVTIRSLDKGFGNTALRGELAWFTATIIAGLLVWALHWRPVQNRALEPGLDSLDARRSTTRKIYVYFFLFVATMTVLFDAVFVVSKVLGWFLGLDAPTLGELAHAIAFSMIAVGVWLYHGFILRSDRRLSSRERGKRLKELRVTVVDVGDGHFGRDVFQALRREMPELKPSVLTLSATTDPEKVATQLSQAELIVGPWTIARPDEAVSPQVSQAVMNSPARKLLAPTRPQEGWEWAGVERWDAQALVQQTAHAVKQMAMGEQVRPVRPLGVGAIIGIIIGLPLVLLLLTILLLILALILFA